MLHPSFHRAENIERVRYAQIGVALIAATVCGYLLVTTGLSTKRIWSAERSLRRMKVQSVQLSREVAEMRQREARLPVSDAKGVEAFAVQFAAWAKARGVRVESLVPEGPPAPTAIKADDVELGQWNACRVRVQGRGQFKQLMDLLDQLRDPKTPVQLDSFAVRVVSGVGPDTLAFDLLLTVYVKQDGTT